LDQILQQAQEPRRTRPPHFPALDGIRLLAVGFVILHHITSGSSSSTLLHLIGLQRGNGLGPPLFFVLSGALLTAVIDLARNTENRYRNFLLRRVLRIFPLYFGYLLLATAVTFLVTGSGPQQLWVYVLFSQNIFVHTAEQTGSVLPTYHLWTIAVQDQFYLVWPLLLWLCKSIRQMRILCSSGIAVCFLARVLMLSSPLPSELLIRSLPAVAGCMCLGGLLALELREPTRFTPILRRSLAPLSVACLIWMWRGLDFTSTIGALVGYQLVGLTCAALISSAMQRDSLVARVLGSHYFAAGGKNLAFGIYMLHPFVLDLTMRHLPFGSKLMRIAIFLVATLALAALSSRFFERPFLQAKIGRPKAPTSEAPAQQVHPTSAPLRATHPLSS
jgi:peptidoglycan/LPS O-acetylase OafA/YrhL